MTAEGWSAERFLIEFLERKTGKKVLAVRDVQGWSEISEVAEAAHAAGVKEGINLLRKYCGHPTSCKLHSIYVKDESSIGHLCSCGLSKLLDLVSEEEDTICR